MATKQATKNQITLRGSTQTVLEFFAYSINSILYQRGIYPPDSFDREKKYNLSMMVTKDEALKSYLKGVLAQLSEWLMASKVQQLVLVITGVDSEATLERWVFNVQTDSGAKADSSVTYEKSEKEIVSEIQALIRQITASVTFLPLLDEPCTFDLLVYTDSDIATPQTWEESDPKYITDSEEVKLRSFTTKIHRVDTSVRYAVK
eukprot:TRINITY_DN6615_c0_g1_i1.p1 TRINITY_DN6615_c0_g1~~TRINITY_DN6615_c0_g1_i1.p1  ORF type:complete len:204 (+),score=51.54 TRINITY_DN6615_c0_g1_i1:98-709(+)